MATLRLPDPWRQPPPTRDVDPNRQPSEPSPRQRFDTFIDRLLGDRHYAPEWVPDWLQGPLRPLWKERPPELNTPRYGGAGRAVPDPPKRWQLFGDDPPVDEPGGYDPTWEPGGKGPASRPAPARPHDGPTQVDDDTLGWLAQFLTATRKAV